MTISDSAPKFVLGVIAGVMLLQAEALAESSSQLCAVCPDPARDIGPDNLPPKEKTGAYYWMRKDEKIVLVRDPDWKADVPEVQCRQCPDPFGGPSWSNLPIADDNQEYIWVRKTRDGTQIISAERNPNWSGGQSSDAEEEPDEDKDVNREPLDRRDSVYHASGQDVFQHDLLNSIGGVLSQGIMKIEKDWHFPTVELVLGQNGEYPGHIIVNGSSLSGRYRIPYQELVPVVLFVASGGTSLFTLWSADKLPDNFAEDAGFVEASHGQGHIAIEFAGTRYDSALNFMDTCHGCVEDTEERRSEQLERRLDTGDNSSSDLPSNYINSDIGTVFQLVKSRPGRVAVAGTVSRFYWSVADDTDQAVSVYTIKQFVRPEELRSNAEQMLQAFNIQLSDRTMEFNYLLLLMEGTDILRSLREEAGLKARRKLADALFLFQTLALLRTSMLDHPDQWSAFVAALSSDWLLAQYPEPWERYTITRCRVFVSDAGCG